METHYDNPNGRADFLDNLGIRITLTSELRPIEAGMLQMGHSVNFRQVIPPGQSNFVSRGFCRETCTQLSMAQANITEFKILGVLQHSHVAGVRITTRHNRDGREFPLLITDPNYDFNFQDLRKLPDDIAVYPGGSFRVDCHYNTVGKTQPVLGGLTTKEEMCMSFAYYYTRTPLANCMSLPNYGIYGVDAASKTWQMIQNADWTNKTVVDWFYQQQSIGPRFAWCAGDGLKVPDDFNNRFTGNLPPHDYVEPSNARNESLILIGHSLITCW